MGATDVAQYEPHFERDYLEGLGSAPVVGVAGWPSRPTQKLCRLRKSSRLSQCKGGVRQGGQPQSLFCLGQDCDLVLFPPRCAAPPHRLQPADILSFFLCSPGPGGHSGATYSEARPMNDLWAFDMRTLAWHQAPQRRPLPLPRFEQAYAQYTPEGSPGKRDLSQDTPMAPLAAGGQWAWDARHGWS